MDEVLKNQSLTGETRPGLTPDPTRPEAGTTPEPQPDHKHYCVICYRSNIHLSKYGFGQEQYHWSFTEHKRVENPDYISVLLCKVDVILASKVRSALKGSSTIEPKPPQIIEAMLHYRKGNPIAQTGPLRNRIPPNTKTE